MMLVLILRRHLFLSVEATSTFNRFVRRSYGGASVMLEVLGLSSPSQIYYMHCINHFTGGLVPGSTTIFCTLKDNSRFSAPPSNHKYPHTDTLPPAPAPPS
jgi:hypothetical protein